MVHSDMMQNSERRGRRLTAIDVDHLHLVASPPSVIAFCTLKKIWATSATVVDAVLQ